LGAVIGQQENGAESDGKDKAYEILTQMNGATKEEDIGKETAVDQIVLYYLSFVVLSQLRVV
jgi:hypothetical protein